MLTHAQNLGGQAAQKVVQKAGEVRHSAQREMQRTAEASAEPGAKLDLESGDYPKTTVLDQGEHQ